MAVKDSEKLRVLRSEAVEAVETKIEFKPLDMEPVAEAVSGYYKMLVTRGVPHDVAGRLVVAWQEVYWKEMSAPRIVGNWPDLEQK